MAEDETMFRQAIATYLLSCSKDKLKIVAEAANGKDLLQKLEMLKKDELPHIILLDVVMPEMDGMETARTLHKKYSFIKIIALSVHSDCNLVLKMLKTGIDGYLHKRQECDQLLHAIEEVMDGKRYFGPEIMQFSNSSRHDRKKDSEPVYLNSNERKVLILLARDYKTKEISGKMFLGIRTIKGFRKELLRKLGAKTTAGAIQIANQYGMV